jgi:hypothetical protein
MESSLEELQSNGNYISCIRREIVLAGIVADGTKAFVSSPDHLFGHRCVSYVNK